MAIWAYSGAAIRECDNALLEPAREEGRDDTFLMRRAAVGLASHTLELLKDRAGGVYGRRVLVLAGPGHNGGDALFTATTLLNRGVQVFACRAAPSIYEAAAAEFTRAGGRWVDASTLAETTRTVDVVLDAIFGIGGRPGLVGYQAEIATTVLKVCAEQPQLAVVAVDLPSGLDADSGQIPEGPIIAADLTVTFGAFKVCQFVPATAYLCRKTVMVDIGLDTQHATPALVRSTLDDFKRILPTPDAQSHKYSRGVLGVVAGSDTYPGAAQLTVSGALATGVGMVRYTGPPAVTHAVLTTYPQVVSQPGRVQAWCVGPGVDDTATSQLEAITNALSSGLPTVVDAGALITAVQLSKQHSLRHCVFTPHAGELATLFNQLHTPQVRLTMDDVNLDPARYAQNAADELGAVVLVKGATTVIATPGAPLRSQAAGPPSLATAGSGDILAGVIGALLATGLNPTDAAETGAWLHGYAAASSPAAMIHDLPHTIAEVRHHLTECATSP